MLSTNLEITSAAEAYLRAKDNPMRRYPSPEKDGERLYPLAGPSVTPTFQIKRDETIFAIGSCFARNIEYALEKIGMNVTSNKFDLGAIGDSLGSVNNFFNKYSIHSICNELLWALERDKFPGEALLYTMSQNREVYRDLQLGTSKLQFPIAQILEFRHKYLDVMARAIDADVIILTLGYVETWFDKELGIYLNIAPPKALVNNHPERFEFRVLSHEDILQGLQDFYDLLAKHRKKPMKVLLTVSPVPLLSTFRNMDVLIANSYSKSVQRGAIDEFLTNAPGVDYFPSYEFVTLSNPTVTWSRGDYRHVSPDVVARIMSNVITNYITPDSNQDASSEAEIMTPEAVMSSARLLYQLGNDAEVLDLLAKNAAITQATTDLILLQARSNIRLKNLDEGYRLLEKVAEMAPKRPAPLEQLIRLCRPMQKKEKATILLATHFQRFPMRSDFRDQVTWV